MAPLMQCVAPFSVGHSLPSTDDEAVQPPCDYVLFWCVLALLYRPQRLETDSESGQEFYILNLRTSQPQRLVRGYWHECPTQPVPDPGLVIALHLLIPPIGARGPSILAHVKLIFVDFTFVFAASTASNITVFGCTLSLMDHDLLVDSRTKLPVTTYRNQFPIGVHTESEWAPWKPELATGSGSSNSHDSVPDDGSANIFIESRLDAVRSRNYWYSVMPRYIFIRFPLIHFFPSLVRDTSVVSHVCPNANRECDGRSSHGR